MNAVGLIERGGACHTIEKKWNPCQVIPLLAGTVHRALASGWSVRLELYGAGGLW